MNACANLKTGMHTTTLLTLQNRAFITLPAAVTMKSPEEKSRTENKKEMNLKDNK
jgi:hypothetical protein